MTKQRRYRKKKLTENSAEERIVGVCDAYDACRIDDLCRRLQNLVWACHRLLSPAIRWFFVLHVLQKALALL